MELRYNPASLCNTYCRTCAHIHMHTSVKCGWREAHICATYMYDSDPESCSFFLYPAVVLLHGLNREVGALRCLHTRATEVQRREHMQHQCWRIHMHVLQIKG